MCPTEDMYVLNPGMGESQIQRWMGRDEGILLGLLPLPPNTRGSVECGGLSSDVWTCV